MKTHAEAEGFGRRWVDAWNRRDLEAVLAMFADDVIFRSPKAHAITGSAKVFGKPALRAYWSTSLAAISTLSFTFEAVLWDVERQTLAIRYLASLNGTIKHAVEIFEFDPAGCAVRGEALYGTQI